MDRAEGLGRLAVLARTGNVELALQPLSQSEMAALFGAVAAGPRLLVDVVDGNPAWVGDDEDLRQLRDRGAIATSNAGDYRDDEPTLPDFGPHDTEPCPGLPPEDE